MRPAERRIVGTRQALMTAAAAWVWSPITPIPLIVLFDRRGNPSAESDPLWTSMGDTSKRDNYFVASLAEFGPHPFG
jgi:hypothetical protein